MAKIYLSLIRKGLKTLENVPEQLREEVRALLETEAAGESPNIPTDWTPAPEDNSAKWVPPEHIEGEE